MAFGIAAIADLILGRAPELRRAPHRASDTLDVVTQTYQKSSAKLQSCKHVMTAAGGSHSCTRLFERSEFLIDTPQKKNRPSVCVFD